MALPVSSPSSLVGLYVYPLWLCIVVIVRDYEMMLPGGVFSSTKVPTNDDDKGARYEPFSLLCSHRWLAA